MSFLAEGSRVSYVGDEDNGLHVGDTGKVLSAAGSGSHVLWSTGSRAGDITLEHNMSLVANGQAEFSYDDNLYAGQLVSIAVRDVYVTQGYVGLLNAMNDEGHFATFAPIAEEAVRHVATKIREDASIKEVLSHLDPDEGAEFVSLAASVLLRDAFGGSED
jgi:hypothetical protein